MPKSHHVSMFLGLWSLHTLCFWCVFNVKFQCASHTSDPQPHSWGQEVSVACRSDLAGGKRRARRPRSALGGATSEPGALGLSQPLPEGSGGCGGGGQFTL